MKIEVTSAALSNQTRILRATFPREWWIVFNLYLVVLLVLAIAGSAVGV